MKAFIVDRYKSKDGVRLGDLPEPEVRDDDVLVEVHAASLNQLDSKIRNGEFKFILPYRLPLILGNDVAGVVVRVGRNVRRFKPGDEVYARPHQDRIGTLAEFIGINEADMALKPNNLTMEEAASIPLVGLTAWQVLIERSNLKKEQKVLIHAGSGGVGTFAIQLAKHIGATVATTTSTANVDLVKSLGADVVIDYKRQDFETLLRGYDVVLNSLDNDTLEKSLKVLKSGGKLISISGPPDVAFAKDNRSNWFLQQLMRVMSFGIRQKAKRHGVSYSFVFMRANGEQLSKITSLIESGLIRPVMDRIFRSKPPKWLWLTSKRGMQKGRSSSKSDKTPSRLEDLPFAYSARRSTGGIGPHARSGNSVSTRKESSMSMPQKSQTSSSIAWKNAFTNSVDAGGAKFAYRQLGPNTGVAVVFLNHLAAELDRWDPRVVDGIAAKHRVVAFDNRGVGASKGSTPTSVAAMARDAVAFIRALGLEQVDLFGFSLGGFISQVIAQEEPQLVRKMILAGTGPAGGTGIEPRITLVKTLSKSTANVVSHGGAWRQLKGIRDFC